MKALQCESAKISPKDMHKGKDRKENDKSVKDKRKREKEQECEIVTTPRSQNETWSLGSAGHIVVTDWICWVVREAWNKW